MSIRLVPLDAYCMLTITMEDLYPGNSWNYVFGWAMYKARTGVFSFLRYDPKFLGRFSSVSEMTKEETEKAEQELLFNACHVMVHETGHMFGITHCTHYECTMNGFNSKEE